MNESILAIWFWRIIVKRPRMLSLQFVALYKPNKLKLKTEMIYHIWYQNCYSGNYAQLWFLQLCCGEQCCCYVWRRLIGHSDDSCVYNVVTAIALSTEEMKKRNVRNAILQGSYSMQINRISVLHSFGSLFRRSKYKSHDVQSVVLPLQNLWLAISAHSQGRATTHKSRQVYESMND